MSDGDVDFDLVAESFTIHASEKVSTGKYESATVSMSIEGSVEGVDITNGIDREVGSRLWKLQRHVQDHARGAAEERKRGADAPERSHEVE